MEGIHHGDWYFPDGDRLSLGSSGDDIYEWRGSQQVSLRRRDNPIGPSGIYIAMIFQLLLFMMILTSQ